MAFELWDIDTENIIGRYESEAEALEVVRRSIERYGTGYVDAWELIQEVPRGEMVTIAKGAGLAERGLRTASA